MLPFDIADGKAVDDAIMSWASTSDDYIALLINNAGIRMDTMMVFMQNEQWNDVINTNLNGFLYYSQIVKIC